MTDPRATFETLLRAAHAANASDVHLVPGERPRFRLDDALVPHGEHVFSSDEIQAIAKEHFGDVRLARQAREGSAQRPIHLSEGIRARSTLSMTRGHYSIAVRFNSGPLELSLERVRAPDVVKEWLGASHGLIVMAGPHGSGKTTTLYAMTEWLNQNRAVHVCTVEDPLSYEIVSKEALVQQREVGVDVPTVAAGISAALAQDLDVLMVAALADLESLSAVLHAAETGHLVLVQVHANSADEALERIVEATPPSMHAMIRRSLSETLRGVLFQRLVRKPEQGRVAIYEALAPNDRLLATIASGGRLSGLPRGEGSLSMRDDIASLEEDGTLTPEVAAEALAWIRN
ncbi:MAG: Flp pilus assembly complex ATPase component TadA [Planctomycetes bacterium]|nr:Flp pilus assembly complex ATPase component TadA [Planctomycetota bacterium]